MRALRFVLALCVAGSLSIPVTAAHAEPLYGNCLGQEGSQNYAVRSLGATKFFRGIASDIQAREAAASCDGGLPSIWVMLQGDGDGAGNAGGGWAQIGMVHMTRSGQCDCLRFFWQWSDGGGWHTAYWGAPSYGTYYRFKVDVDGSGHAIMRLDSNNNGIWETPPNNQDGKQPETTYSIVSLWDQSIYPVVAEERFDSLSQFYMGCSGLKANLTDAKMRIGAAGFSDTDFLSHAGSWLERVGGGGQTTPSDTTKRVYDPEC